jgi:hypothetical protein
VPSAPRPFIPPELLPGKSSSGDPLAAEVVVVSSPAAVGKSTVARYLASANRLPFLNLAHVPVSTNAFVGLLVRDVVKPTNAVEALHQGQLTVVADALDEGRLLSGDANFEAFLETTWELLLLSLTAASVPSSLPTCVTPHRWLPCVRLPCCRPDHGHARRLLQYKQAWVAIQRKVRNLSSSSSYDFHSDSRGIHCAGEFVDRS